MEKLKRMLTRKEHIILAVVLVGTFALKLWYGLMNGMWVDEGRYGIIATALLEHPLQYASPWHGVVENYVPVFPYLVFLSQLVFGQGNLAVHIVSPVMSTLTAVLTYLLGREMFSAREGLAAAVLVGVAPVLFFLSARVLIGPTLTFFITLTLFLIYYGMQDRPYARYARLAIGPAMALSFMTKQPAYMLPVLLGLYLLYRDGLDLFRNLADYRDIWISAGLGLLVWSPWLIRSMYVCGLPLCGLYKTLLHVGRESAPAWANTGGTWYYLVNLGSVVSLPVAALFYLRYAVGTAVEMTMFRDARRVLYVLAGVVAGAIAVAVVKWSLIVLVVLLGVAALQDTEEEFLLWALFALGVGGLSVGLIKVPRYVVFVTPAVMLLVVHALEEARQYLDTNTDIDAKMLAGVFAAVVLIVSAFALVDARQRTARGTAGFQQYQPAGEWLHDQGDVDVIATSPRQLLFYADNRPNMSIVPANNTKFRAELESGRYDYLVVDVYERTRADQVRYVQQELSGSGLIQPVQVFRQNGRPVVVIYAVTPGGEG
jgi:4-amino-4-deoxy-L-arabinose transferase-like glycosyltransferase